MYRFEIQQKSKKSKARLGVLKTPHGDIRTPSFIPVATLGVVKGGLSSEETSNSNVQCQITNTFHFLDLDRVEQVNKKGGLHKFFNFNKPIFTDSGGFQVFSLGKGNEFGLGKIGSIFPEEISSTESRKKGKNLLKISQRGARFCSPRDGREILLTPELSFKVQRQLGADFVYLLDVCGSPLDNYEEAKKEMDISHQWFKRFLKVAKTKQKVFGIIQGGVYSDLRKESTKFVNNLPVFGIAIGGALGKDKKEMYKIISDINKDIDWQRPHHLLGIGDLEVMEKIIELGIDLFDCALPTRIARHGSALTSRGRLNIKSGSMKDKFEPIEKSCKCPTCQNYTIAQINFLFRAKETLAGKLLTIHNLFFIETYLEKIRKKIAQGKL
ncbi:MAG: tRNA guanosine(34) transglycosylase Tgt [Patescibacteria group bacterium]|nr:tRNA guanosine(34) transglycosylase Tgt [Patescibacteria group bacterium]